VSDEHQHRKRHPQEHPVYVRTRRRRCLHPQKRHNNQKNTEPFCTNYINLQTEYPFMKEVKPPLRQPAPFWKRLFAYLLDLALINLLVVYPFRDQLKQYSTYAVLTSSVQDTTLAVIMFIVITLTYLYFIILEHKTGQTLGKILFKIRVVSTTGTLTLRQILIRNITKPFPIVLFVDTLYKFFSKGNQRLFEKFSSTQVVAQP